MSKQLDHYRRVTGRASYLLQQFSVDFMLAMESARLAYEGMEDKSEVAQVPNYPGNKDDMEYFQDLLKEMSDAVAKVQGVPAGAK